MVLLFRPVTRLRPLLLKMTTSNIFARNARIAGTKYTDAGSVQVPAIDRPPCRSRVLPFPSFTPKAAEAARKVLADNHQRFHIYFNHMGFHNHFSHHVLAALSMGLPAEGADKIYEKEKREMLDESWEYNRRPVHVIRADEFDTAAYVAGRGRDLLPKCFLQHGGTAVEISESNWTAFANDRAQYWPYLAFFHRYVDVHGVRATLERFVFSKEANKRNLDMLARLVGGALHPFIHVGYGAEFGLNGLVAEGLAMAIITENTYRRVLPTCDAPKPEMEGEGLNLFSICDLIGQDPDLAANGAVKATDDLKLRTALSHAAPILKERGYFDLYRITEADVGDPDPYTHEGGWMAKWEELVWFSSALLLGSTSRPGKAYKHDFFLMHINNATLFFPALLPILAPAHRVQLLDAYVRTALILWIARGTPHFFVRSTLNKSTEHPRNPHLTQRADHGKAALLPSPPAWYEVAATATVHADEHLTKAIRSLMAFDQYFAHRAPGFAQVQTEQVKAEMQKRKELRDRQYVPVFEGLEELDGSAFLRTAGQVMQTQNWKTDRVENIWYVSAHLCSASCWLRDSRFYLLNRNYDGPGFPETWEK